MISHANDMAIRASTLLENLCYYIQSLVKIDFGWPLLARYIIDMAQVKQAVRDTDTAAPKVTPCLYLTEAELYSISHSALYKSMIA